MIENVGLEGIILCARIGALLATERFFSRMVALEMRGLFGGVIALCARKRLFTTVNQHMTFQMVRPIACVFALVATEMVFSRMKQPHVAL